MCRVVFLVYQVFFSGAPGVCFVLVFQVGLSSASDNVSSVSSRVFLLFHVVVSSVSSRCLSSVSGRLFLLFQAGRVFLGWFRLFGLVFPRPAASNASLPGAPGGAGGGAGGAEGAWIHIHS